MKTIKLSILLLTLAIAGNSLCADESKTDIDSIINIYGTVSSTGGPETEIPLEVALEVINILSNQSYSDGFGLNGVLRAQFSSDTTIKTLGATESFRKIFPKYQSEATAQLQYILDSSSEKPAREKAFKMLQLIHWLSFDNSFTRHNIPTSGADLGIDLVSFRSDGMSALSAAAYEQRNEIFDVILELLSKEDLNKKKSDRHRTMADQTKHMVKAKRNKASVESKIDAKLSS